MTMAVVAQTSELKLDQAIGEKQRNFSGEPRVLWLSLVNPNTENGGSRTMDAKGLAQNLMGIWNSHKDTEVNNLIARRLGGPSRLPSSQKSDGNDRRVRRSNPLCLWTCRILYCAEAMVIR